MVPDFVITQFWGIDKDDSTMQAFYPLLLPLCLFAGNADFVHRTLTANGQSVRRADYMHPPGKHRETERGNKPDMSGIDCDLRAERDTYGQIETPSQLSPQVLPSPG